MKPCSALLAAAALLGPPGAALRLKSKGGNDCPSMMVAVFSREDGAKQRGKLREMWANLDGAFDRDMDAGAQSDMMGLAMKDGWSNLIPRFAICTKDRQTPKSLEQEQSQFGDLLFIDCEEGYGEGLLTRKTLAAMQAYREEYSDQDLFMKVDDDTFVARHRLCDEILQGTDGGKQDVLRQSYMGVVTPKEGVARPHRNKTSPFYEPPEVYPNETYPTSMLGGPGYIVGRGLVEKMLDRGIPERHLTWVEDKAVGIWIHDLEEEGTKVNWVDVPGTDGYSLWQDHGRWGDYPYTLRHHLSADAISCMAKIALKDDPNSEVDGCFKVNW